MTARPSAAEILAFERRFYARPGAKEQAIVTETGMSITRYYQQLNETIDDPGSLAIDAQTVRRLQRLRSRKLAG